MQPEALLAHADFVRRLSKQLLSDEHLAEDVVQETWLAALSSPPRERSAGRGWLATIVRNLSRNKLRDGSLRETREAEGGRTRSEYTVSTEQVVQRESARQEVVRTVLQLEEPYRSTILLIYFDGRTAAEVARHAGIPAATVRSRLQRGLDQLRERLDRAHGGDRRTWLVALAPFAAKTPVAAVAGVWVLIATLMQYKTSLAIGLLLCLSSVAAWSLYVDQSADSAVHAPGAGDESKVPVAVAPETEGVSAVVESRDLLADAKPGVARAADLTIVVRVVKEGQLIAGAEVRSVAIDTKLAARGLADTVSSLTAPQSGSISIGATGAAGALRVASESMGDHLLFVSHGEDWGGSLWTTELAKRGEPIVIELHRDRTLRARVTNPRGAPVAGAPLAFGVDHGGRFESLQRTVSDAAGEAVFRHVQFGGTLDHVRGQVAVGIPVPLRSRVMHAFTLDTWPANTIELELPDAGAVTIGLVDRRGEPWSPPDGRRLPLVSLTTVSVDGKPVEASHTVHSFDAGGTLRLKTVGLGLRISVEVDRYAFASGELEFAGPTRANEDVRVDLPIVVTPIITGRLLDSELEPIRSTEFDLLLFRERQIGRISRSRTDADGRFDIPVKTWKDLAAVVVEARGEQARLAIDPRKLDSSAGLHDLGDVRLQTKPVALSGRVVDAASKPIAGARVRPLRRESNYEWGTRGLAAAVTDADGRFTIRGTCLDHGLFAHIQAKGFLVEQGVAFRFGQRDAVYVLRACGSIEAELLLDPWVDTGSLLLTVAEHATDKVRATTLAFHLREGRLDLRDLSPGMVSLQIQAAGAARAVFDLSDIEVFGGESTELAKIDLRGKLHRVRLHVVDERGEACDRVFALIDPDVGRPRQRPAAISTTGTLDVLALQKHPTITVAAPGRRSVRVVDAKNGQRVVLPMGIEVGMHVAVGELPEGVRVDVALRPRAARLHMRRHFQSSTGANMAMSNGALGSLSVQWRDASSGKAMVRVPAEGGYDVLARVFDGRGYTPITLGGAKRVAVAGNAARFTFECPMAIVQKILRRRNR